jgi:2-phosphoglycerate kinase
LAGHERTEVLLIGGRSGVGKTTARSEVSARLQAAQIAHAYVEGDDLDQAVDLARDIITATGWRNADDPA